MDTTTCTTQHLWTVGTWCCPLQTKTKIASASSSGRRPSDEQHQWNCTFCVFETCLCPVTFPIPFWKRDAVHAARQGTRLCTRVLCLERVFGASATHSISTQGIRMAMRLQRRHPTVGPGLEDVADEVLCRCRHVIHVHQCETYAQAFSGLRVHLLARVCADGLQMSPQRDLF